MVQFNFSYQTSSDGSSGVSSEQMTAFEMAGRIWSAYLNDDVTVNVHIGMSNNLPTNVIGGALPGMKAGYSSYEFASQLRVDRTSQDDQISTNYLSGDAIANDFIVWHQEEVSLTTANAKALGIIPKNDTALDGVILMSDLSNLAWNQDGDDNNDIAWDFLVGNASQSQVNDLDFLSVALHELGHILGFVSGVDNSAWFQELDQTKQNVQNGYWSAYLYSHYGHQLSYFSRYSSFGDESRTTPLDFFRYSDESAFWGVRDLSVGEGAYFSIDGGYSSLADFSTSKYGNGDGYQASHWKNAENALGIMTPTLALDQENSISMLDLRAFDVIGWDLADSLLGNDSKVSQWEFQQTLDLSNSQTLNNLWQSSENYVLQNRSYLERDRLSDVFQMIENSEIYERKKKKNGKEDGSWQELWQEIVDVFSQEGSFSTFEVNDLLPDTHPFAESKIDYLRGTRDDDNLKGAVNQDWLIGKQGQDFLKGKDGDDLLKGGNHRDVLVGGAGFDVFVVQDKQGFDIVRDFIDGEDRLKLGSGLSFEDITISQQGNHTVIEKDNDLLMVLRSVDFASITAIDFTGGIETQ
ncbi:MAG: NF038122 family metalloprotease [Cyanobacteria bacterium P01_E01_bin.6]